MKHYKAPEPVPSDAYPLLFLAGSIEMGKADNWQQRVVRLLANTEWIILNPRRNDWDDSWEQDKDNAQFRQQVEWELAGQERAHRVLLYFDPATKSPISLLELGLFRSKMLVVCPKGFYRKGNVDIVCERYHVPQYRTIEEACQALGV